ncbi:histidine-specific methyltransferase [Aspergillus bertholletiae]|uniref:Histidine-specific methyltransferase n=1 Tax=Aspergillus bertholletiae TaxID=1226010 RepID=A0A5N7B7Q9_9EURO|nr:histidine-specific methyltransferase [Aspergillus bertholletiae]
MSRSLGNIRELRKGLTAMPRRLPSLCAWDKEGLQLFEQITHNKHYYPFYAEKAVLQQSINTILDAIPPNSTILELGSGSLEKTGVILEALDRTQRTVDYYALDICPEELDRTLSVIQRRLSPNSCVRCHPLVSTYEDSISWVAKNQALDSQTLTVLWLGSSIANETPNAIRHLLGGFESAKHGSNLAAMQFLVGLDGCKDIAKINNAYDTPDGLSRKFALNSLQHANNLAGYELFHAADWVFRGFWDSQQSRYNTCIAPTKDVTVALGNELIHIPAMELVHVISSRKIGTDQLRKILVDTGFELMETWMHPEVAYGFLSYDALSGM